MVKGLNKKWLMFLVAIILACMITTQAKAQQATVSVAPSPYTVPTVGSTFDVNITVANVEDLYGWGLKLYYPNDVLNGTNVAEGPFLKMGGSQTVFLMVNFTDTYNATYGIVDLLCTRTGGLSGVNGSGTLATISFISTSTDGPKTLHLSDVALSDYMVTAIPFTPIDGEITVIPEFRSAVILPLLAASTLLIVSLWKRKCK